MRVWIVLVMLTVATPVYAQTSMGSTSGASSMVDIDSPANTTAHVITAPTVAAPGLAAAGASTNGNGYAQVQTSGYAGGSVAGFGMHTH